VLTVADPLQGTSIPLGGAKISLQDALGTTLAVTYTAADGEFAFYDLADGTYTLLSSAEGYVASSSMTAVITGGSISNVTMSMVVDSRTYNGTVSGIIRNSAGLAVAGCFVGLYQVVTVADVSQELLIATTKTNDAGKYLFGGCHRAGIPGQGQTGAIRSDLGIQAVRRFCLCDGDEAHVPLCLERGCCRWRHPPVPRGCSSRRHRGPAALRRLHAGPECRFVRERSSSASCRRGTTF
jgi:hypothetical protein